MPAFEIVGLSSTFIVILSLLLVQKEVIVHSNILSPMLKPVTFDIGFNGSIKLPVPLISDQLPFPIKGIFPDKVASFLHIIWSTPAIAVVGEFSLEIINVLLLVAQLFEIVQTNLLIPSSKFVTSEVGECRSVMVPLPLNIVQVPIPSIGKFPSKKVEDEQTFISAPTIGMVGDDSTVIVIVAELWPHILEIVQANLLTPRPRFDTEVFGVEVLAIIPEPLINDQIPLPIIGVFADIVVEFIQIAWSTPTNAVVGLSIMLILTTSEIVSQAFFIVHLNTFSPIPKPVIVETSEWRSVMIPLPLIKLQVPTPSGLFTAAIVARSPHIVWSNPAFALKIILGDSMIFIGNLILQPKLSMRVPIGW